jgi:hypothetical protein
MDSHDMEEENDVNTRRECRLHRRAMCWSKVMVFARRTYTLSGINTVFVENGVQKVLVLERDLYVSPAYVLQKTEAPNRGFF